MVIDWKPISGDFQTIKEHDEWVIKQANLFTVVRYLGPRNGYERHETKTLPQAEALAGRMADMVDRIYLIYAVAGERSCFVKSIHPKDG